jgi:hypothetical protein
MSKIISVSLVIDLILKSFQDVGTKDGLAYIEILPEYEVN